MPKSVLTNQHDLGYEAANLLQQSIGIPTTYQPLEDPHAGSKIDGEFKIGNSATFFTELKKKIKGTQPENVIFQIRQMDERAREAGIEKPWLLITTYLTPTQQQFFRSYHQNYIDLAGNAYLQFNGSFVLIEGKGRNRVPRWDDSSNMSPVMLRLTFAYLIRPEIISKPYREQEILTGVGKASISEKLQDLQEMGYLSQDNNGKWRLKNQEEIARKWVKDYPEMLRSKLVLGRFKFSDFSRYDKWQEIWPGNETLQWGGEPAGAHLTKFLYPGEFQLYTSLSIADAMRTLRLIPDPNGPIHIYRKFWPSELISGPAQIQSFVPNFLVYADLVASRDSRNLKIANMIKHEYLGNLL